VGDRLVAIAATADPATGVETGTALLTSTDGSTWTRLADVDGRVSSLVLGGPGLIAVGTDPRTMDAAIWLGTAAP